MNGEARGVPNPYAPRAGRRVQLPAQSGRSTPEARWPASKAVRALHALGVRVPCLPYSVSWKCELAMAPGPVASGCGPVAGLGFESSAFRSPSDRFPTVPCDRGTAEVFPLRL